MAITGCGDSERFAQDEFVGVTMEEGGMCDFNGPCVGWRTSLGASRILILDNSIDRMQVVVSGSELSSIYNIVSGDEFVDAITSVPSSCPPLFDAGVALTLQTKEFDATDTEAGGCMYGGGPGSRPYQALYLTLDRIRRAHFPDVLPWPAIMSF
jgi:hypothetical protein